MVEPNKNMELWEKVYKTDKQYTKEYKGKGGFVGTAITAQYQVKIATEQFGIFGSPEGWGIRNQRYEVVKYSDDAHDNVLVYTATLYYNFNGTKGELFIDSSIDIFEWNNNYKSWNRGNDLYKKVKTDAMTKGLSLLGFNADVFMNDFSAHKYAGKSENSGEGSGDKKGEKKNNGSPPAPSGTPADDDGTIFLSDDDFNAVMKETVVANIEKVIADYTVEGKGIKAKHRSNMLGRIKYLEQEAAKQGGKK